jgi:hypothetical protein
MPFPRQCHWELIMQKKNYLFKKNSYPKKDSCSLYRRFSDLTNHCNGDLNSKSQDEAN